MIFRPLVLFLGVFLGSVVAFAAPTTLTYQGRILKSDGTPLEYNNVSFIFQVTNPTGSCILYQEQVDGYDMTNSGGVFDTPIGSGGRTFPASGTFTIADSFSNAALLNCQGGSTYAPMVTDGRVLRVQFNDGAAWRTISPDNVIRSVPYANFADASNKLGTYVPTDFVLKNEINSNVSCNSGNFLTWDATTKSFGCNGVSGAAGGTVTSIIGGTGLTGGTITSSGTLAVNVGTGASQIVQLDGSAKLPAVDGSALTNLNAANLSSGTLPAARLPALTGDVTTSVGAVATTLAKIQGTALTITSLASGNYLKYNGTAWVNVIPSTADLSDASSLIKSSQMPANCAAGQTLTFSSPTGTWACSNIVVTASNFGSQTQATFLAAPTGAAGAPTFRTIASTDLPTSVTDSLWTASSGDIYRSSGNVGIGAATPARALHVVGAKTSDNGDSYSQVRVEDNTAYNSSPRAGLLFAGLYNSSNATAGFASINGFKENSTDGNYDSALSFHTRANGGNLTERMRIDHSGNVGIGTTAPTTALQVNGTITATAFSGPLTATVSSSGAGSASAPSMTFTGDPDTGFYDASSNNTISVATGGTKIFDFSSAGIISPTAGGADITSAAGTAAAPTYSFAGDTATGWYHPATSTLAAATAGVERVRIDASGNFGIGTNSPSAPLHVLGSSTSAAILSHTGSNSTPVTIGDPTTITNDTGLYLRTQGLAHLKTAGADLAVEIGSAERVRIATTGYVGIGTTVPIKGLHIAGTGGAEDDVMTESIGSTANSGAFVVARARGTSAAKTSPLAADIIGTYDGYSWNQTTSTYDLVNRIGYVAESDYNTTAATAMTFTTKSPGNLNERMRITSAGNVGIGTTSPSTNLHVRNSADAQAILRLDGLRSVAAASTSILEFSASASPATTDKKNFSIFNLNGASGGENSLQISAHSDDYSSFSPLMTITHGGNVGIGITAPTNVLTGERDQNSNSTIYILNSTVGTASAAGFGLNSDTAAARLDAYSSGYTTANTYDRANSIALWTNAGATGGLALAARNAASGIITFHTGGNSERMRIDQSGNLGIGTTAPIGPFQIKGASPTILGGTIYAGGNETTGAVDTGGGILFMGHDGTAERSWSGIQGLKENGTSGNYASYMRFSTRADGGSQAERLRITSAGYVGIGTTSPSSLLTTYSASANQGVQFSSAATASTTANVAIRGNLATGAYNPITQTGDMAIVYSGTAIGAPGGLTIVPWSSTGSGIRMDSSGNVAIGTSFPTARLLVSTTAVTGNIASFVSTGSGGAGCSIAWNGTSCSSDARLKENVVSTDSSVMLDDLLKLRPVHFTWIKDPNHDKQTGFIAQEFEKFFPEFVKNDDNGYKQVNYAHFVSVITSAVQEFYKKWQQDSQSLHREITSVKAENEILRQQEAEKSKQIEELKARLDKIEKSLPSK